MKDSDFPKAITAIAEASRFIQIEKYSGIFTPAPTHETATSTKSQSTSSQLITPQSTTTQ